MNSDLNIDLGPAVTLRDAHAPRRRQPIDADPTPGGGAARSEGESPQHEVEHSLQGAARRRDSLYRRALTTADAASSAAALTVAVLLAGDTVASPTIVVGAAVAVLIGALTGLYARDQFLVRKTTLEEAPALLQFSMAYSLLVWAAGGTAIAPVEGGFAKEQVLALGLLLVTLMMVTRICARGLARRRAGLERCLVLGDRQSAETVLRSLDSTRHVDATVVGHVPLEGLKPAAAGGGNALDLAGLAGVLDEHGVERVVVAPGAVDSERVLHALRHIKALGAKVSVLPGLFQIVGSSARVDEINGLLLLGLPRQGLTKSSRRLKRSVDVLGALAALLLLAPLFAATATAVRLGSVRPVFARERLVDPDGRAFDALRFNIPAGNRVGEIVRALRLDGLPRLASVLVGNMSLVGSSPVRAGSEDGPTEHVRFGQASGRLPGEEAVLPGLTGLWRIRHARDAPRDEIEQLDYLYCANWSLWLDARILLRTVPLLLGRPRRRPRAPLPDLSAAAFAHAPEVPGPAAPHGRRHRSRRGVTAIAPPKAVTLSVIVPATNRPPTLDRCLSAIRAAKDAPEEVIVVDDPAAGGPGSARNDGARRATGDVLVFVDADVTVHPDAFGRIRVAFEHDAELVGVFGSYDDEPDAPGLVSAFRNLLHHHVHQNAVGAATTFWAGLGAIRRDAFFAADGFDPTHPIEDIELGMRLAGVGARIRLDPRVRGKHLKAWTIRDMVRTDFIIRGAPWVELLLRHGAASRSTLNLGWRHRLSAGFCLVGLVAAFRQPRVTAGAVLGFIALNGRFYGLLLRRRGPVGAGAGLGLHILHHLTGIAAIPAGLILHLANRTAPAVPAPIADPTDADAAAVHAALANGLPPLRARGDAAELAPRANGHRSAPTNTNGHARDDLGNGRRARVPDLLSGQRS